MEQKRIRDGQGCSGPATGRHKGGKNIVKGDDTDLIKHFNDNLVWSKQQKRKVVSEGGELWQAAGFYVLKEKIRTLKF